jgi:hypothetical protein
MYLSTMHSLSDTVPSITLLGYASNAASLRGPCPPPFSGPVLACWFGLCQRQMQPVTWEHGHSRLQQCCCALKCPHLEACIVCSVALCCAQWASLKYNAQCEYCDYSFHIIPPAPPPVCAASPSPLQCCAGALVQSRSAAAAANHLGTQPRPAAAALVACVLSASHAISLQVPAVWCCVVIGCAQ